MSPSILSNFFCSHLTILLISFSVYSQCSQLQILIFFHIFRYIKWLGLSPPWLSDARKGMHSSQTDLCDGNTSSCTREVTSTPKLTQKSTQSCSRITFIASIIYKWKAAALSVAPEPSPCWMSSQGRPKSRSDHWQQTEGTRSSRTQAGTQMKCPAFVGSRRHVLKESNRVFIQNRRSSTFDVFTK